MFSIPKFFLLFILFAQFSFGNLVITEVMSNSAHPGGPANGDWWELTNTGQKIIPLFGYVWNDEANPSSGHSIFPNISINPQESILIVDELDTNFPTFLLSWRQDFRAFSKSIFSGDTSFSNLNATSDSLYLYDENLNLVDFVLFPEAVNGFSFDWSRDGEALGLSQENERGAYRAFSDGKGGAGLDIASPGQSIVPEPSISLFLFLFLLLLGRRNRISFISLES